MCEEQVILFISAVDRVPDPCQVPETQREIMFHRRVEVGRKGDEERTEGRGKKQPESK